MEVKQDKQANQIAVLSVTRKQTGQTPTWLRNIWDDVACNTGITHFILEVIV